MILFIDEKKNPNPCLIKQSVILSGSYINMISIQVYQSLAALMISSMINKSSLKFLIAANLYLRKTRSDHDQE